VPTKPSPSDTMPPDGWITRNELVAATGVSDRNLLNWCAAGLIPRPERVFRRGVRGATGLYRAESIAMIRRLYELQQEGRDLDAWRWGLWIDPADHPVDIWPRVLERLDHLLNVIHAIGEEPDKIEPTVASALKTRRAARLLNRRGMDSSALRDFALWAYRVAADIEQQERLDSGGSPILDTLRRVAGLPSQGFPAPDRELGVELSSIAWFREVLENASPDQREQVRRDCRAIDRLAKLAATINWHAASPALRSAARSVIGEPPEPRSITERKQARKRAPVPEIVRFLLSMWSEWDVRAIMIPALMVIRQSPEHGKRLTEILALATAAAEFANRLPETDKL
jgi:hypothetical protein